MKNAMGINPHNCKSFPQVYESTMAAEIAKQPEATSVRFTSQGLL